MVGTSNHHKALHSLHIFSMIKSSSSTLSSMKLKTLVQTFIFTHFYRIARALNKAKSILTELVKDIQPLHLSELPMMRKNKSKNKLLFGSFRLHYNWCSSHVMPMRIPVLQGHPTNHLYYDSSWNSMVKTRQEDTEDSQLSGYLHWLEEKCTHDEDGNKTSDIIEIDQLADMFIASCHEKFRLEKQESYRRFQEMMARSV